MKLNYSRHDDDLLITLEGRLDATWAEYFRIEVAAQIRAGGRHLIIDASRLQFLSSAGIRALLQMSREVKEVNGTWQIVRPTPFVRQTLEMSGFSAWLIEEVPADFLGASSVEVPPSSHDKALSAVHADGAKPLATHPLDAHPLAAQCPSNDRSAVHGAGATPSTATDSLKTVEYEHFHLTQEATLRFSVASAWRPWNRATLADVAHLEACPDRYALGIGSLAATPEDAAGLFGEFVSVAGHIASQPADPQSPPDYLVGEHEFVPSLQTLQALVLQGEMRHLLRFSAPPEGTSLGLSALMEEMLQHYPGDSIGWVMLAEVEGVVGSALIRSPALRDAGQLMTFPEVRDWISFCGERLFTGQQALMVGMVSRTPTAPLASWLTPLASSPGLFAHAHAAIFPYQPLPRGNITMAEAVRRFFLAAPPLAVLHLLDDQRPLVGLGETLLRRGACWFSPLESSEVGS